MAPICDVWRPRPTPNFDYLNEEDLADFFFAYFKTEYDPEYFEEAWPVSNNRQWELECICRRSSSKDSNNIAGVVAKLELDKVFVDAVIKRFCRKRIEPPNVFHTWSHQHHHSMLLRTKRYDLLEAKLLAEEDIVRKLFNAHIASTSPTRSWRATEVRTLLEAAKNDRSVLGWMFDPAKYAKVMSRLPPTLPPIERLEYLSYPGLDAHSPLLYEPPPPSYTSPPSSAKFRSKPTWKRLYRFVSP